MRSKPLESTGHRLLAGCGATVLPHRLPLGPGTAIGKGHARDASADTTAAWPRRLLRTSERCRRRHAGDGGASTGLRWQRKVGRIRSYRFDRLQGQFGRGIGGGCVGLLLSRLRVAVTSLGEIVW